jgi:hypothetical protein
MAVKKLNVRPLVRTVGALLLGLAVAGAPALSYAQHGSGGGGGGHFGGGGGAHFGGGGGHFAGGAHFSAGHFGGAPHYFARSGGFAGGYGGHFYGGGHYAAGARGYAAAPHYGAGFAAGRAGAGRVFYPGRGGFYAGRGWGGGYWGGVFWPRCWFYPGFAWFLPVLPFGYATFWWGGIPYYYVNDLYYTYSPADNGYVATEPPPAAGDEPQGGSAQAAPAPGDADLYLYPRNGQSDQQMSNDRYECHSWATGQTGFDPTKSGVQPGNADDYRRAMIACLDARGYSAR